MTMEHGASLPRRKGDGSGKMEGDGMDGDEVVEEEEKGEVEELVEGVDG